MSFAGLDHVVLAVSDLERDSRALGAALGLVVEPGGAHANWGTANAIARFGVSYLEVLGVRDLERARSGPAGARVLEALAEGPGWLGFALGTDDLDRTAAALEARGVKTAGIQAGSRARPDGTSLQWRTLALDPALWGGVWPFVIQHETPPEVRSAWAPPGGHPLGARGVKALGVAVESLDRWAPEYEKLFGVPSVRDRFEYVAADRASWKLPDGCIVRLMAPRERGKGPLADHLRRRGESLFVVGFGVSNLNDAVAEWARRGTGVSAVQAGPSAFTTDLSQTLGAAFAVVQSR